MILQLLYRTLQQHCHHHDYTLGTQQIITEQQTNEYTPPRRHHHWYTIKIDNDQTIIITEHYRTNTSPWSRVHIGRITQIELADPNCNQKLLTTICPHHKRTPTCTSGKSP